MSHQQIKQARQNSVSSIHKQGQQHGHRKNFSSQLENKNFEGSPKIGMEFKQLLTPSKAFESPVIKKGQNFSDNKPIKQNTSMTNLRSIISQSTSQSHISPNAQTLVSTQSNNKGIIGSTLSNKSLLTSSDSNAYLSININQAQNLQLKEHESAALSPIEEININSVKKTIPFTSIAQNSRQTLEIPRSTLNFNIDNTSKKAQNMNNNQLAGVLGISNNQQTKGQEMQQIPIGINKMQQQKSLGQLNNNYYSKSSYNMPQPNLTPSTTAVNTQSISNIINKTNPIMQNFQQQQQQNQNQINQNNKNVSLNQNNQQIIYLQQSPLQVQQPNLMQINGATLTESQNTQNAQNTNPNVANSQSRQSSITNISNFLQNDYINALKNEDQVQDAKTFFTSSKDQMNSVIGKQQRSISKEYSLKKEPSTISLRRKESYSNQNHSGSRNNSQNQKINNNYSVQINTGASSQLNNNSQELSQNQGKIIPSIQIQNYEESRKHTAPSSHLGIKNANINLSTLTNSQSINNSISQTQLNNPNYQALITQQSTQLNSSLNNSAGKQSDNNQQPTANFKSQFRKESLIAFQLPQQKQFSKQSSSTLFVDIEESLINNQVKRCNQRSHTQLNTSPGRDRSPPILQSKQSSTSQRSIQDISPSTSVKLYNKRHTEIYSPQKSLSPNKSLFQMVKLAMQQSQQSENSSIPNSPLKIGRKNKRNMSYVNLPSDTSGNIKTFLRFRPNNNMELELNNQGLGQNIINFIDDYSVSLIGEQQQVYTVDKIFTPNDTQETIYFQVGKEVIVDVFLGYNGTIFTYGVTGSGKTHTMFGNITDQVQKGIIPRICNQIFDLVENDEEGTEFIINCSMLEIYKEILYDSFQEGKEELKIKENVQKGIYVQGLTQTSIANQDELIQLINIGYNTKRTRETRLNEYSSRSHTIFMIEIQQRLSNGDEKIGKINLIDLAGAEKVSRSGAQGESLEEAIKINLSLSCLGKVIHALTSGNEYIPYRDSKLTRILQESLGGNYKTSLIVTCSMHSSFQDDTISSLKFATRAKTIKNTFKMNIKVNPINLQKELETLKIQTESYKYMLNNVRNIFFDAQNKISSLPNISSDPKLYEIKNKLDEFLTLQSAIDDISTVSNTDLPQLNGGVIDNKLISTFLASKKDAQMMVKDENIKQLMQTNSDLNEQIQSLQQENQALKKENLNLTVKLNEISQEKNQIKLQLNKQLSKNDYSNFSLGILQKQIQHLVDSVCGAEKRISSILQEKKLVVDIKFEDYLKEKLSFSEIVLADYFKNSINFNFESAEKGYKDVQENLKKFNLEGDDDFMAEKSMEVESSSYLIDSEVDQIDNNNASNQATFNQINPNKNAPQLSKKPRLSSNSTSSFVCNIDSKIFQNENNEILKKIFAMPSKLDMASVSETVSNDFIIVSLKKQLIDSHILNQNLLRTVNALEWKQIIEYGKSKLKSDQIQIQRKQIKHLENVLEEVTENHKELRLKIEDLEFDMYQQYAQQRPRELSLIDNKKQNKNKIIIPLTPQNVQRQQLLKTDNKKSNFGSEVKSGNFSKDSLSNFSTIQKDLIDIQQSFKEMELDIIPLTYQNALDELKKRNIILKRIREINMMDFDSFEAYATSLPQKETDESIKNERERLNNKIIILQQELKMEQVKVESIKHSLLVERKNVKDLKKLTENMEVSLRNTLKEENDSWQQTINEVTELNKVELTKRQAEYNQLREIFFNILEFSLQKIQEMKGKWSSQEVQELENIIIEMEKAKLQIGKCYENAIKKRSRNSSIQSIQILTPKRPPQQPLVNIPEISLQSKQQ
ncbi:kinesin motor catalytic domain protein (macronuclear) [Tetrahymena thermophila SB210]|uniref:Kinesin motor catalytic domain protein n=1 Tax=Tetrahymena thermophila (strain SB210) TaxID=312017 RepID=I7ME20_TETTS|nr:kinesin motor catalytic domain protein [Tetrahymena thermophila SB210]EAR93873.2 kinesin motor catalytic domain protein [Tetrahymena thermophila SB210]|eukprot:XP_001014118.2 kinesin motor catalytic domain protein [Tetrahymena thermophila SB210]